jgi:hypothetical protein
VEDTLGAKLSVETATGHWFNEAGERFAEGVPVAVTLESLTTLVIGAKLEGVEVEITCSVLEGEGTITNPTEGRAGTNKYTTVAKKCTVPKPAGGGCKVHKESFHLTLGSPLIEELVYKGTALFDALLIGSGGESGKITLEGCSNTPLNKTRSLEEVARAEPSSEKSSLKFTATSGSELKLGGQAATFTSEDRIEVEGGGKIQAG